MEKINIIIISGIFILIGLIISIIFIFTKINNTRQRRRRNNRISPEMYNILANIIRERNRERVIRNYEARKKELELIEMKNKYRVVVINPDNNIELGIKN